MKIDWLWTFFFFSPEISTLTCFLLFFVFFLSGPVRSNASCLRDPTSRTFLTLMMVIYYIPFFSFQRLEIELVYKKREGKLNEQPERKRKKKKRAKSEKIKIHSMFLGWPDLSRTTRWGGGGEKYSLISPPCIFLRRQPDQKKEKKKRKPPIGCSKRKKKKKANDWKERGGMCWTRKELGKDDGVIRKKKKPATTYDDDGERKRKNIRKKKKSYIHPIYETWVPSFHVIYL